VIVRIEAGVLIPGQGEPIPDGTVVLDGPTISYAGPRAGAPDATGAEIVRVPVVMPGLWDCHAHFMGIRILDLVIAATEPLVVLAARKALDAGFTSVREAGGYGVLLARAVDDGSIPGPHIYGPGAILSTTGGHGDLHSLPLPWMLDLCARDVQFRLCDGVPECLRAVREQLRLNARAIKICASGGVFSELDDPIHQQFSDEEMRAIVEEAGRAERIVMAHCHGKPGITAALRAGVRTIEHGSYLDEECAAMMRESGAILVPTRLIVEDMLAAAASAGIPDYAMRKAHEISDRHFEALQLAIESGVTVAMGTDIVSSLDSLPAHWGDNGRELGYLVKAGMSNLQAIEAATATAPLTLGPQAPKAGQLVAGYDADVIAVSEDPSRDVAVLADPDNVTHVWKSGALVKAPR
jgi:imidazolonepropionase-like amidohydrolase